ncbi:hypothetical protein FB009_12740 [Sinorhizobium medicae]|nr:hypothetical protein FB009_12740 [Sinorhizobium medicae]
MISGKRRRPVVEDLHKPSVIEILPNDVFVNIGEAVSVQGSSHDLRHAVERHLTIHPYPDFASVSFELPRIKASIAG